MSTTKHFNLRFPQRLVNEPILYNISIKFGIVFNITRANVSEAQGFVTLSLTGDDAALTQGVQYMKDRGVMVEEIPSPVAAN